MDDVKIINDRLIASCRNASSDCGRVLHEYGINKITATFSGSGRAEDEDACNRSYEMGVMDCSMETMQRLHGRRCRLADEPRAPAPHNAFRSPALLQRPRCPRKDDLT